MLGTQYEKVSLRRIGRLTIQHIDVESLQPRGALLTFNPRNVHARGVTKVDGGLIETKLIHGCPKVELIASGVALEALERVLLDVCREAS